MRRQMSAGAQALEMSASPPKPTHLETEKFLGMVVDRLAAECSQMPGCRMRVAAGLTSVEPDDFARRFSMRGSRLMWLLGAGASASAGIPTAWDMVWEFKQQLFVSQRRVAGGRVSDL